MHGVQRQQAFPHQHQIIEKTLTELAAAHGGDVSKVDPFAAQKALKGVKGVDPLMLFPNILVAQDRLANPFAQQPVLRPVNTGSLTSEETPMGVVLMRTTKLANQSRSEEVLKRREKASFERRHLSMLRAAPRPAAREPKTLGAELKPLLTLAAQSTAQPSKVELEQFDRKSSQVESIHIDLGGLAHGLKAPSGRSIAKMQIDRHVYTQNLMVRITDDRGGVSEHYVRAGKEQKPNLDAFEGAAKAATALRGDRFELDKSARPIEPSKINWDVEMTTPETVKVYKESVYPAISGVVEDLVKSGGIPPDAVVFDVGCGRGDLSHVLHQSMPKLSLKGGEFNGPSLDKAKERWELSDKNPPEIFEMNAVTGLKKAAEERGIRPDVVVMSGFIARKIFNPELCQDPAIKTERDCGRLVMKQVHDILKPGGCVVMAQKTDNLFSAQEFRDMGFEVANTWSPEHQRAVYVLVKPRD